HVPSPESHTLSREVEGYEAIENRTDRHVNGGFRKHHDRLRPRAGTRLSRQACASNAHGPLRRGAACANRTEARPYGRTAPELAGIARILEGTASEPARAAARECELGTHDAARRSRLLRDDREAQAARGR